MDGTSRRALLIDLLTGEALTSSRIAARLRCTPRQAQHLLRHLRTTHPQQLCCEQLGRERRYRWRGAVPVPVPNPVTAFSIPHLLALATARGVLAQPGPNPGPLATALDDLIDRSGLRPEIRNLTPGTIEVAGHARVAEDARHVLMLVEAIRTRDPVRFTYTTSKGDTHHVHAVPARLRMVAAEWHVIAWFSSLSMWRRYFTRMVAAEWHVIAWANSPSRGPGLWPYRLARITDLEPAATIPGGWSSPSKADLDSHGRAAFGATAGQPFAKLVLGIDPRLMPHISGRTWGLAQKLVLAPDLGRGWHRLTCTTAGLDEARHKILSWGELVRVEGPNSLTKWLRQQATAILAALPQ